MTCSARLTKGRLYEPKATDCPRGRSVGAPRRAGERYGSAGNAADSGCADVTHLLDIVIYLTLATFCYSALWLSAMDGILTTEWLFIGFGLGATCVIGAVRSSVRLLRGGWDD